jgi:hypothetical protein
MLPMEGQRTRTRKCVLLQRLLRVFQRRQQKSSQALRRGVARTPAALGLLSALRAKEAAPLTAAPHTHSAVLHGPHLRLLMPSKEDVARQEEFIEEAVD